MGEPFLILSIRFGRSSLGEEYYNQNCQQEYHKRYGIIIRAEMKNRIDCEKEDG